MPDRLLDFAKRADWLTEQRIRAYSLILLIVMAAGFALWAGLSHGLIDRAGKPLGSDFVSFYAASKLALSGHAADAWNPVAHQTAEDGIFGRSHGYWAFFYPPACLLLCLPFALLPYGAALAIWLGATAAAAVAAARKWIENVPIVTLLAFPALWINIGNGQNAALFTAIALVGCVLLKSRPIAAGLVFGLLVMKPQLAIALPFLLAVSGRWKTFFATGFSATALCLVAWLAVGTEGYAAFLHNSALARATLDNGLVAPDKMQSWFAALRLWDAPLSAAYTVQAVVAAAVLGSACYMVFKYKPDPTAFGAIMVAATLQLSPFLLDYDLLLLAVPLGWLVVSGRRNGFRDWEKSVALLAFILPMFARPIAANFHVPLTPFTLLALYAVVLCRVAQPRESVSNALGSSSDKVTVSRTPASSHK